MIITKKQAAELLNISVSLFEKWEQKFGQVPSFKEKATRQINVSDLIVWESNRRVYEVSGGRDFILDDEKARLAFHQANRTELQTLKMRGELVDAVEFKEHYLDLITALKKSLLAIPSRISYELSNIEDEISIREIIKKNIKEALIEMSDS